MQILQRRAQHLLEISGLDALPGETIPALAPQMSSPPENDLQNNKGLDLSPGKKFMKDGWVNTTKPQSTQLHNVTLSPVSYVDQNSNTNPYSGSTVYDESLPLISKNAPRALYILHCLQEYYDGGGGDRSSFLQRHGGKLAAGALLAGGAIAAHHALGGSDASHYSHPHHDNAALTHYQGSGGGESQGGGGFHGTEADVDKAYAHTKKWVGRGRAVLDLVHPKSGQVAADVEKTIDNAHGAVHGAGKLIQHGQDVYDAFKKGKK